MLAGSRSRLELYSAGPPGAIAHDDDRLGDDRGHLWRLGNNRGGVAEMNAGARVGVAALLILLEQAFPGHEQQSSDA